MPNSRWMVRWGAVIAKNLLRDVFLVLLGNFTFPAGCSRTRDFDYFTGFDNARHSGKTSARSENNQASGRP